MVTIRPGSRAPTKPQQGSDTTKGPRLLWLPDALSKADASCLIDELQQSTGRDGE